jgi:hypothetical protein
MTVDDPTDFFIASVQNGVIQEFNDKIRAASKSLQGLVALGELGETTRMLNRWGRQFYDQTSDYLRDLKRIACSLSPRNLARTVSEKWLEYRFGVRPLVNDIGGFIDACYQARYGRPPSVHIRSGSKSTEKNPPTTYSDEINHFLVTTSLAKEKTYGFKLYGVIGLTDSEIPPFRQDFGITLDEFVPTLWELIPYSFLVDYVSNVGAIIDAYSLNKSGLKWVNQGELRESSSTMTSSISLIEDPPYVVVDSIIRNSSPYIRKSV